MKKQFLALALVCASFVSMTAQNMDYRSTVSFNAGASLFNLASGSSDSETFKGSSIPTLQLSYDYAIAKWFSLGGALSYNKAKAEDSNYSYIDDNGNFKTGSYKLGISRTTVGLRALFHYGNTGKLDMYSGLRLGVGIWNLSPDTNISDFDAEDAVDGLRNGVLPQVQVVAFGLRYYVTDNFGLGFETALGSPYFSSLLWLVRPNVKPVERM